MEPRYFPELATPTVHALVLLLKMLKNDPQALLDRSCPYPPHLIEALADFALSPGELDDDPEAPPLTDRERAAKRAEKKRNDEIEAIRVKLTAEAEAGNIDDLIEKDLQKVLIDLKVYGATLGAGDQTEKMSYFRTITALIERLVMLRERAAGVKLVKDFENSILSIMEDVLTPEQRTQVMDNLRSILSKSKDESLELATDTEI